LYVRRLAGLSALHAARRVSRDDGAGGSGERNHDEIRRWRRRAALEKTLRNRPDLLDLVALSEEDKKLLAQITGKN